MTESERQAGDFAVSVARLEGMISGAVTNIEAVRQAAVDGVQQLDKRVSYLEDVRVRALEDWRLSRKVLEEERAHVQRRQFTRFEVWAGITVMLVMAVITLCGVLVTAHVI